MEPTTPATPIAFGRHPERGSHDAADVAAALDAAALCHVAFVDGGVPCCIPTLHVRIGEHVYLHGSAKSRMMVLLAAGADACLTATVLDGLVLARSAFHHSVNYRSAVVFGRAEAVDGEEKRAALEALVERMVPGRAAVVREPSAGELVATTVVRLPLTTASAKRRGGPPIDAVHDVARGVWAGVLPVELRTGEPARAPDSVGAPGRAPSAGPAFRGGDAVF